MKASFKGVFPARHRKSFRKELASAINRHSRENGSNTPDFILAEYLEKCLGAYDAAVVDREQWYGESVEPGK